MRPYLLVLRRDTWIASLGTGATLVIVVLAWAAAANRLAVVPAFFALLGTLAFAALAIRARFAIVRSAEALDRATSRSEAIRAELEEQRRSVDALADGLDVALFICDTQGIIHYANPTALSFFRIEDPVGRTLLATTLSYDLEQFVIEAARSGELRVCETSFAFPTERITIIKAWQLGHEPGRVFLTVYDATDLRRLERVRQDFVANVSHELRTPMTLIRAMAETLLDDVSPDEPLAHRYLSQIISEVDRLSGITQDLLVLSAAESNTAKKQTSDLAEIVQDVVAQLELKASDKGLALSYDGPESLAAEVNATQMMQVAINLVENAIKYTQSGAVMVRLFLEGKDAVLQVSDTGIGIASEHQRRVFERFYRVDKARARASGGTGLGLSIVKHIVEAHGGSVSLTSELNVGSTLTARVPIEG